MGKERAVKRDPQPGQESVYPQIHGQTHNFEEPPPSYEFAQLSVPHKKTDNPEVIVPVPQPQMYVLTVNYPEYEPNCEDYCCACCCPPCFVTQKRGCCGIDCWINLLIGAFCCWPCNAIHSLTMLREPDFGESRQPVVTVEPLQIPTSSVFGESLQSVVTVEPLQIPSSSVPNMETVTILKARLRNK